MGGATSLMGRNAYAIIGASISLLNGYRSMYVQLQRAAAALVIMLSCCAGAAAQTYPSKPVRIIMGFPAGSTVDVLVRPLAQHLTQTFGQQFIVDNRAGATGVIASELVAKAPADGYTLLGTPSSAITSTPHLSQHLPFDPLRDFVSINQINWFSYVLITHPSVPAKSVSELIALAKSKPGVLTYGSSGVGSAFHLAGELFRPPASPLSVRHGAERISVNNPKNKSHSAPFFSPPRQTAEARSQTPTSAQRPTLTEKIGPLTSDL